jgi:outer membrane biogenesis lipoprotein LolB
MIKCFYKVLIVSVLCIFLNACTSTKSTKSDKEQEIEQEKRQEAYDENYDRHH